ncbi:hypothetical protein K7A41_16235 [Sphingobacterium sp. InxBP1]|uniref:hypothetical protein n=1 Tax=Sphingobacterium sp. InxBP1 TaxID=2870328 RepID=UPI00224482C6|nr:hypothetical protein [Sphingobacterium sp. InxBP1]MCW8312776.1 hypothetical protein [Sphingobacterium sp. InxBP1]
MAQTGVEPVPTDGEMKLPTSEIILTKDNMHEKERELFNPRREMVALFGKENILFEN